MKKHNYCKKHCFSIHNIKNQTISHGRAAELLGIHKLDLIAMYGNLGIPYLDCDISDIEQDVKTLREILVTA